MMMVMGLVASPGTQAELCRAMLLLSWKVFGLLTLPVSSEALSPGHPLSIVMSLLLKTLQPSTEASEHRLGGHAAW